MYVFYVSGNTPTDFVNPYTGKKIKGPFLVNLKWQLFPTGGKHFPFNSFIEID